MGFPCTGSAANAIGKKHDRTKLDFAHFQLLICPASWSFAYQPQPLAYVSVCLLFGRNSKAGKGDSVDWIHRRAVTFRVVKPRGYHICSYCCPRTSKI